MNMNFQTELKYIDGDSVSCDGGNDSSSHPLIFLDLSSGEEIICPYCSKRFKKK